MKVATSNAAPSGDAVGQVNSLLELIPEGDEELGEVDIDNDGSQEIEETEEVDDLDQEIDEEVDKGEQEGEEESGDEDDETGEEDDSGEISSINELAEHLETEEDVLYNLEIPMGDGLEPISISALKDSYMEGERNKQQIKGDREQLQADQDNFRAEQEQTSQLPMMNDALMKAATEISSIEQAYAQVNWEELEVRDPTQALLQQNKMQRAYETAQNNYVAVQGSIKKTQDDYQVSQRKINRETVLRDIPEWKDSTVLKKDSDAIAVILTDYGYSNKEISNVTDPRLSKLMRDFMILKGKTDKADATVKKLRKMPKKISGSSKIGEGSAKKLAFKKKVATATKSKDIRDKVGAVSELINL